MMAADQVWANGMRAEALATLFLTRYGELDVIPVSRHGLNRGYDILVRFHAEGTRGASEFAVETKGVRLETTDRTRGALIQIGPDLMANANLPLVLFVFDVDNETGSYRWLIEPVVTEDGQAVLLGTEQASPPTNGRSSISIRLADLQPLDDPALNGILGRVAEWSGARDCLRAPVG